MLMKIGAFEPSTRYAVRITIKLKAGDGKPAESHTFNWRFKVADPTHWHCSAQPQQEWQSVDFALRRCQRGDVIHLSPGKHVATKMAGWLPGVSIIGSGMDQTTFTVLANDHNGLSFDDKIASFLFQDLTFEVPSDRNSVMWLHKHCTVRFRRVRFLTGSTATIQGSNPVTLRFSECDLSRLRSPCARIWDVAGDTESAGATSTYTIDPDCYFGFTNPVIGLDPCNARGPWLWRVVPEPRDGDGDSLTYALRNSHRGDVIVCAPGLYRLSLENFHRSDAGRVFVTGAGAGRTVIRCTDSLPFTGDTDLTLESLTWDADNSESKHAVFVLRDGARMSIRNIRLSNVSVSMYLCWAAGNTHFTARACDFSLFTNRLLVTCGPGLPLSAFDIDQSNYFGFRNPRLLSSDDGAAMYCCVRCL